jgi:hypothetical protein
MGCVEESLALIHALPIPRPSIEGLGMTYSGSHSRIRFQRARLNLAKSLSS